VAQANKEATKEAKRLEKVPPSFVELIQERKLAEKAAQQRIDALNRLKTRKETGTELIVYLPPTLPETVHGTLLSFLEPLGIDTREWQPGVDVLKFVRKVVAEWDEEGSYFKPVDEYRRDEEWILHYLPAESFVEKICFDHTGLAWQFHLDKVKRVLGGKKMVLVLEGLASVFQRAKNATIRAHDAFARGAPSRVNKDERLEGLDTEKVEEILIEMELLHEIRVVQTTSAADSAEWISILATDISSIPYRYITPFPRPLPRAFFLFVVCAVG
jgi:ERCC4 domain